MRRIRKLALTLLVVAAPGLAGCSSNDPAPWVIAGIITAPIWIPVAGTIAVKQAIVGKKYPPDQQPMYGGAEPSAYGKGAIERSDNSGVSREQGSKDAVAEGWKFFSQKNYIRAIGAFNNAWLLDSDNGDAFYGFAMVVFRRDRDIARADEFFKMGLAKPRQGHAIYLDYGHFLLEQKRYPEAIAQLNRALTFSDMGPDAEALLTQALFLNGDVHAACAHSEKVQNGAQKLFVDAARRIGSSDACKLQASQ